MKIFVSIFSVFLILIFCSCTSLESLDSIYFNGTIHTMEDTSVSAVGVKDGKINMVGTFDELKSFVNEDTDQIDLQGSAMLPGFIDAHSHFTFAAKLAKFAVLSPPPIGNVDSFDAVIKTLQENQKKYDIPEGDWISGWGYDQDQLKEQRHPNRYDLDEAFPNHPVFLYHISGHMGVVNSKALELLGISAETPDPAGGIIVRNTNSKEPSGLLLESASASARSKIPVPAQEERIEFVKKAQEYYVSQGVTTAQDGFTSVEEYEFLKKVEELGVLEIDIEVLAGFQEAERWLKEYNGEFGKQKEGVRLTGLKITTDGSPQGKTAFFSKPYHTKVPGCVHSCTGVPILNQSQLDELINKTYSSGIQTYVHCNGDASIDLLLNAHKANMEFLPNEISDDSRTVIIHSQFVRNDQLDDYKSYGMVPSFFSNHAFYWGDVHVKNLGKERAHFLSPMKTALEKGITFTNHTDYIVTPLNQLFLAHTAVNRTSRSGEIIGPDERISIMEALKAITINAAYQHKTEETKGSIAVGKMADFVILNQDPLSSPVDKIKDIKVLKTIKEGKVVFTSP